MKFSFPAAVTVFIFGLARITGVSANGHVNSTIIDGVRYDGYNVDYPEHPKIFRSISGNEPIKDIYSPAVQCGRGDPAPLSAKATAGSEIQVLWGTWPGSHLGPVAIYLARCPDDCSTYIPGYENVWFKIAQSGKANSGTYYNVWPSHNITNGRPYTFTLPPTLHQGNYIVRVELISLHLAQTYPGIEIHPSCFQISVSGTRKGVPAREDLVSIPGAYDEQSEGVTYDIYSTPVEEKYVVPGPDVARLVE